MIRLTGALVATLVLAGCASKATVHGTVTHERTRGIVKDARVVLTEAEGGKAHAAGTNYAGQYRTEVKAGRYAVAVEHANLLPCQSTPTEISVAEGQVMRLDLCVSSP